MPHTYRRSPSHQLVNLQVSQSASQFISSHSVPSVLMKKYLMGNEREKKEISFVFLSNIKFKY